MNRAIWPVSFLSSSATLRKKADEEDRRAARAARRAVRVLRTGKLKMSARYRSSWGCRIGVCTSSHKRTDTDSVSPATKLPLYFASLVACDAIQSHSPSVCFIQVSVHAQRRVSVPDAVLTTVVKVPTMIAVPPNTCTL